MKICLSSRQTKEYLQNADEIKVEYRDKNSIPDLIFTYPEATIILVRSDNEELLNWDEIKRYKMLTHDKFIMAISSMKDIVFCNEHEIPWYAGFPVKTFYELHALKNLGACYVRLGEPLFFMMDQVSKIGVPVRAVPNVAYIDGIFREDGVCGTWIRPEDLEAYEPYITTIEFEDIDRQEKEQALYRIYVEDKKWAGTLGLLVSNFNYPGVNRMIPPDLIEKRLNCGQRCQETGHCKICYRMFDLAQPERYDYLKETTDQS